LGREKREDRERGIRENRRGPETEEPGWQQLLVKKKSGEKSKKGVEERTRGGVERKGNGIGSV